MANPEHLAILKQGVKVWNKWREENPDIEIDLSETDLFGYDLVRINFSKVNLRKSDLGDASLFKANLSHANLSEVDLSETDLVGANLSGANLSEAILIGAFLSQNDLSGANFSKADLSRADLSQTVLSRANLRGANLSKTTFAAADMSQADLSGADLSQADLFQADLQGANLEGSNLMWANLAGADLSQAKLIRANLTVANLVQTNLNNADLSGTKIYGVSAWDIIDASSAKQTDLIITVENEPIVTVDSLEIAQFVYLLLNNPKIRDVIDTIGKKAVLILGRFTDERKAVLEAIREELRRRDYIPILFDFEKPASRDLTETISTLAHLSRFIIADLSDPNSIPHELMSFAEKLLSVPVKPIFCPTPQHPKPYPMLEHLQRFPHVLSTYFYDTDENLMAALPEQVIAPAEAKANEMRSTI